MNDHFVISNGNVVAHPLTKRQRFIRRAACAAIAFIAAIGSMLLASPGVAHADRYTYLDRLVDAGFYGSTEDLWVQMGYAICNAQSGGVSNASIAADIVANTGAGIYTAEAYEIIYITNQELCTGNGGRYLV